MNWLIKKFRLNNTLLEIVVLNKPESFTKEFEGANFSESLVHTSCVDAVIIFTLSKQEFIHQMLTLFPRLQDHSIIWVAYPVETSKKQLANLHIELDWDFLGDYKLQPTRQITINKEWKAIKLKKEKNTLPKTTR